MTREELITIIYNDTSSVTCHGNCDAPEKEGNTGECCRKCAEKLLTEYEQRQNKRDKNKAIEKIRKQIEALALANGISFEEEIEIIAKGFDTIKKEYLYEEKQVYIP